jgi:UDP-GlcNAc:undecaprenyl-phosphate/decaprenyl-phosphate GlcNAc-1-phosphate transferase
MRRLVRAHPQNKLIVQHVLLWAPFAAFAVALATTWWLRRSRLSALALDHPNQRSLHASPVPRVGGIGVHAGIACAWLISAPNISVSVAAGLGLLLVISLIDDMRGVPVSVRLAAHLLAAGVFAAGVMFETSGALAALAVVLAVAWMTNLYNFMDGADGLAGGMAAIGFSCYGVGAWLAGSSAFAALNFGVAAASAGFLLFNFHPARVFLGDVGSVPLGFLAATFGIVGWLQQVWTPWFPLLVFSPFIIDASVTLARRLARRERVWEAHRDHYYQRLIRLGWGHRKTAYAEYGLMLGCGLAALAGLAMTTIQQTVLGAGVLLVYLLLMGAVDHAWRQRQTEL